MFGICIDTMIVSFFQLCVFDELLAVKHETLIAPWETVRSVVESL
jgi:hypothetical protein